MNNKRSSTESVVDFPLPPIKKRKTDIIESNSVETVPIMYYNELLRIKNDLEKINKINSDYIELLKKKNEEKNEKTKISFDNKLVNEIMINYISDLYNDVLSYGLTYQRNPLLILGCLIHDEYDFANLKCKYSYKDKDYGHIYNCKYRHHQREKHDYDKLRDKYFKNANSIIINKKEKFIKWD